MIPVVIHEGVSGHEALAALAALRAAGLPAELVGEDALVLTQEGARLVPARLGYASLAAAEAVVLPGGDATKTLRDAPLAQALRARRGRWLLASGDALRLLHALGLSDGRRVAGPGTARLVADGRILTTIEPDAIADLALHYVSREHGDATARRAAERLGRAYNVFAMGAEQRE